MSAPRVKTHKSSASCLSVWGFHRRDRPTPSQRTTSLSCQYIGVELFVSQKRFGASIPRRVIAHAPWRMHVWNRIAGWRVVPGLCSTSISLRKLGPVYTRVVISDHKLRFFAIVCPSPVSLTCITPPLSPIGPITNSPPFYFAPCTTYKIHVSPVAPSSLLKRKKRQHERKLGFTEGNNHPRYVQAKLATKLPAPKLTNTWAAGLSLAKCHAWKAAPYDPGLRKVFHLSTCCDSNAWLT